MKFLEKFSKNTQILSFMKILPMGVELFLADGQTNMTKLMVFFCNFRKAPKKIRNYGFFFTTDTTFHEKVRRVTTLAVAKIIQRR